MSAQRGPGLEHRVGGAELPRLEDEPERGAGEAPAKGRLHRLGLVADHHHDPVGAELQGPLHRVVRQWPACHLVEHLGAGGLHPRPLPCGEDDGGERRLGTWHVPAG